MKRLQRKLDPSRVCTTAMNGGWGGVGVSNVVDVQGCNYNDRLIDAVSQGHPRQPMIGTETASTLATRGIYANDKARGYMSAYDTEKPAWGNTAEEWWSLLRRARVAGRRICVDRIRLSRRDDAVQVAVHQLALRHSGYLRLCEGHRLLLQDVVGRRASAAPAAALELGGQGRPGDRGLGATATRRASSCS